MLSGQVFGETELRLGLADLTSVLHLSLECNQVETKLQELVSIVVVIPEEALESRPKERDGLRARHQRRERIRNIRELVRLISHEESVVRIADHRIRGQVRGTSGDGTGSARRSQNSSPDLVIGDGIRPRTGARN